MNDHEFGFTTFLAEPGQRRIRTLLELGGKRRKEVRALLDHSVRLDQRFAQELHGDAEDVLRKLGAPTTCFVISGNEDLDGREMPLGQALRVVGPTYGGFVSCIPGKLGYYMYEDAKSGYLLKK